MKCVTQYPLHCELEGFQSRGGYGEVCKHFEGILQPYIAYPENGGVKCSDVR
jgi:hypothetical protein